MVGRGPKMSFVLRGNPGLQAASSQEATFPGLKHLALLYLQAVLLKMQNLRGEKGNLQLQPNHPQQELAVPFSVPQFPHFQGGHQKGFIKQRELGTRGAL